MANRYKNNVERLVARSKNEIARMVKDQALGGDQSRSLALGANDPRHRSGADASALTGQRYNPEQFWVDDDGRLNIRREAVKTLLLEEGERDTGGGGGAGYMELRWPGPTNGGSTENADIDDGFVHSMPGVSTLTQKVYLSGVVPPDFDPSASFTLKLIIHVNGVPVDANFDIELWGLEAGTVNNGAASAGDYTVNHQIGSGEQTQHQSLERTISVPASQISSTAKAIWFRFGKGSSFTGDYYIPNGWITY